MSILIENRIRKCASLGKGKKLLLAVGPSLIQFTVDGKTEVSGCEKAAMWVGLFPTHFKMIMYIPLSFLWDECHQYFKDK